jgi:methylphosphotriester-DNA--protein-cysteine methyltransferase
MGRNTHLADERVEWLMRDLFERPERYSRLEHVLHVLRLTTNAANKLLHKSGFCSLENLRTAARVTNAYGLLSRPGLTIRQIAKRVGCGSADSLTRAVRLLTGLTPAGLRTVPGKQVLAAVVTHCRLLRGTAGHDIAQCTARNSRYDQRLDA